MNALTIAQGFVDKGVKETNGANRSPLIDAWERELNVGPGVSWCAVFQSICFKRAWEAQGKIGTCLIQTAGSQAMLAWFKAKGWASDHAHDVLNWKGALIIRTDPGGEHGHVALVKERLTTNGILVAVQTLEGNTDQHGGSNGDGAYERHRVVPLSPYKWTWCNTSELAGGAWF